MASITPTFSYEQKVENSNKSSIIPDNQIVYVVAKKVNIDKFLNKISGESTSYFSRVSRDVLGCISHYLMNKRESQYANLLSVSASARFLVIYKNPSLQENFETLYVPMREYNLTQIELSKCHKFFHLNTSSIDYIDGIKRENFLRIVTRFLEKMDHSINVEGVFRRVNLYEKDVVFKVDEKKHVYVNHHNKFRLIIGLMRMDYLACKTFINLHRRAKALNLVE